MAIVATLIHPSVDLTPDNGQPIYNHPGYGSYGHNNAWNNNRQDDQYWQNNETSHWANPNKGNMRQGWNSMTNKPGRIGEMPGGWRRRNLACNPVDTGEQVQDNVGTLPKQLLDRHPGAN